LRRGVYAEDFRGTGDVSKATESDAAMNIGEILISESSNLLLLIPVVIGLVMLVRWFQGRIVYRAGLVPALWPSTRESLHPAPFGSGSP
jgi:hypothetical protein